jgi:hypothetical protein
MRIGWRIPLPGPFYAAGTIYRSGRRRPRTVQTGGVRSRPRDWAIAIPIVIGSFGWAAMLTWLVGLIHQ